MEESTHIASKNATTGSILSLDGNESLYSLKDHIADAWPKTIFYRGNAWVHVSAKFPQTEGEHRIISQHEAHIKSDFQDITTMIELGFGQYCTKTEKLLALYPNISVYYIVDINQGLMKTYMPSLVKKFPRVRFLGLWGTFDKARCYLKQILEEVPQYNVGLISLDSTISNAPLEDVIRVMGDWTSFTGKSMIGHDSNTNGPEVKEIYSSVEMESFIFGGLLEKNRIEGKVIFIPSDWKLECETKHNPFRVVISIIAQRPSTCFEEGTKLKVFESCKHPMQEVKSQLSAAGYEVKAYTTPETTSYIYVITPQDNQLVTHSVGMA